MQEIKVVIIDPVGLHARPVSTLVAAISKYKSEIVIIKQEKRGNLKSILNVMALGIQKDDEVSIQATGIDEKEAITQIKQVMVDNKLI